MWVTSKAFDKEYYEETVEKEREKEAWESKSSSVDVMGLHKQKLELLSSKVIPQIIRGYEGSRLEEKIKILSKIIFKDSTFSAYHKVKEFIENNQDDLLKGKVTDNVIAGLDELEDLLESSALASDQKSDQND